MIGKGEKVLFHCKMTFFAIEVTCNKIGMHLWRCARERRSVFIWVGQLLMGQIDLDLKWFVNKFHDQKKHLEGHHKAGFSDS